MPGFSLPFIVETDATVHSRRAPIAFFSKVLGSRARMKSIYEKEFMAIVFAVPKWRHYLLGRRFLVKTN